MRWDQKGLGLVESGSLKEAHGDVRLEVIGCKGKPTPKIAGYKVEDLNFRHLKLLVSILRYTPWKLWKLWWHWKITELLIGDTSSNYVVSSSFMLLFRGVYTSLQCHHRSNSFHGPRGLFEYEENDSLKLCQVRLIVYPWMSRCQEMLGSMVR